MKLENLTLADNRLEAFNHLVIEKAVNLQSLDLSGNKFMDLKNEPIVKSKSLKVNICKIKEKCK